MVKVSKSGYHLTLKIMSPLAWIRFPMDCVTIVARISLPNNLTFYVTCNGRHARTLNLFAYDAAQNNIMLASAFVCTLYVECILR